MSVGRGRGIKPNQSKTICWDCANAYGQCSWSALFIPVLGWEATKTAYEGLKYTTSYVVHRCPKFVKEEVRKSKLPKIPESELPLLEDIENRVMYCVTDDVYFTRYTDCARYIEKCGGYTTKAKIYWVVVNTRDAGKKKLYIGGKEYVYLRPKAY